MKDEVAKCLEAIRAAESTSQQKGRGYREKPSQPSLLAPHIATMPAWLWMDLLPKYIGRQHFICAREVPLPNDCPPALGDALEEAWSGNTHPLQREAAKRPIEAKRRALEGFLSQSVSLPTMPNPVRWQIDVTENEESRDALCRAMEESHGHGIGERDFKLAIWFSQGHALTDDHKALWGAFLKIYGHDPDEFFEAYSRSQQEALEWLAANPLGEKIDGGARNLLFINRGLSPAQQENHENSYREKAKKLRLRLDSRFKRKLGGDHRGPIFASISDADDEG